MTVEEMPEIDGDVRRACQALMSARQLLGAEYQALAEEEKETNARERQETVRRVREDILAVNDAVVQP
ncbi:hypothetical protein [Kitasatospora sp. P5_F3]